MNKIYSCQRVLIDKNAALIKIENEGGREYGAWKSDKKTSQ